jgi:hypothetical protein
MKNVRVRAAMLAALSTLAVVAAVAPAAQANVLSLLPGGCGSQTESQPFANWGDSSNYTPVPGGDFEATSPSWTLSGGAKAVSGNETYYVAGAANSRSLSLPAGSSTTSLASCTSIYHPTLRLFVRNTGASTSRLKVQALYPGLLGGVQTATLGELSASSSWAPSPAMPLLVSNLLATLSLDRTVIAFRFTPADSTGAWSIDDVYLDPYARG